jgi:hypothetical protein
VRLRTPERIPALALFVFVPALLVLALQQCVLQVPVLMCVLLFVLLIRVSLQLQLLVGAMARLHPTKPQVPW